MPQVVNGCGTWYYGKKNVEQHSGNCRACGRYATLTSYDTRLFVVVVFIPIIPLARKRIIEQCAACRRHIALPWSDWHRAQGRAENAIQAYRQSPSDPELAKEALAACASFRNLPALLQLAPEIEKNLATDEKVPLMLAACYDAFARIQDSERVLRAAVSAHDTDDAREALADCLRRQGKPDEAEPLLQHIVQQGVPDRVDYLYQLAQAYQIKGQHDKALAYFDHCEAVNPMIAQDKTFARLRLASEKARGTNRAIKPVDLVKKDKSAARRRRFMKTAPIALLLAALAYLGVALIIGMRRQVFLVNGLDRAYSVRINGATQTLAPNSATKYRLAEGDVKLEIVDPPPFVQAAESVVIRTNLWSRPFASHTFVINPDRAAILRHSRFFYSSSSGGASPPTAWYFTGAALHHFDGIDCPFEDPPHSLSSESHNSEVSRDGVDVMKSDPRYPMPLMLMALAKQLGKPAVALAAKQHLLFSPDQREYLGVLQRMMAAPELAAFLKPMLDRRPILLQWHRAYQDAMFQTGQDQAVQQEYDAMLAREPQSRDLMYLVGRAARNVDKANEMCRLATTGDAPCAYGFYSLAGYHLANAQFGEARSNAQRAASLLPDEPDIKWYLEQSLIALDEYEKAAELMAADESAPFPRDIQAYVDECYVRAVQKQPAAADQAIDRLRQHLTGHSPEEIDAHVRRTKAQLFYCTGNTLEFVKVLAASSDPDEQLVAHLTAGDLDAAERTLAQTEPDVEMHLLAYLLAARLNRTAQMDPHLHAAANLLAKGDYEDRAFAAALLGKPTTPLSDLLRSRPQPIRKAIILTVLGTRDPTARQQCFELARKLNYDRRFPYLMVQAALDAPPAH